jgi:hypothetical protein
MEVHFPPELQEKLDHAAAVTNSAPNEYLQQLVENYLDQDILLRRTRADLDHADDQLASGQFTEYDETTICELAERVKTRGAERIDRERNNGS